MSSSRLRVLPLLALLLLPRLVPGQTCCGKPTVPAESTTKPSTPRPPSRVPRVIVDLSGFHLDQAPKSKMRPQVGAGSRGSSSELILCAPTLGLSSSTHPLFEWKVPGGAPERVTFSLMNADGDVLYENEVAGSSLVYPNDTPPLVSGQTYTWKVSGGAMNKLPEAVSLQVQDKQAHDSVMLKSTSGDAAIDPLAQAQVFLQQGLWYDTVGTLQAAIAAHPERKDLVEQLAKMYQQIVPACVAAR